MEQNKITHNDLLEQIRDLESNIKTIKFYLENGATLKKFCDWQDDFKANFEYFIKSINDYSDQYQYEELERLRKEL